MLTKFEVKNFKNFKENFVFDFTKINDYKFNTECIKNNAVNKAIIYGPNGCGKSNLGFALFDITSHLADKQKGKEFYVDYLNAESTADFAEFRYTFTFDKNTLEYFYCKNSLEELVNEELFINGKKLIAYDRRKSEKNIFVELEGTETLNKLLNGNKISAVKFVNSNSVLKETEVNKTFVKFYNFVDNMLLFKSLHGNFYIGFETGGNSIHDDIIKKNNLDDFQKFLNISGIKCKLRKEIINGKEDIVFDFGAKSISFSNNASMGTRSLTLFYYWMQRLKNVSFVFIDEFDAFYHHSLARTVVEKLKEFECQTILTTHNTSIMTNDLLRPDCYFLLNNNRIKPLPLCTDKELRQAHNLEKMLRAEAYNV
ncbi:MAG: ATP-binding protein [Candidatus Delongbacteria bacterium]|jgi:AAA15 family ATPase/GTPase|nr:ATP-binding protein [Candidatus Delongbacteria bacterium]